jgi:hypothetical protein
VCAAGFAAIVFVANGGWNDRTGEQISLQQRPSTANSQSVAPDHEEEGEETVVAQQPAPPAPVVPPVITAPSGSAAIEQTAQGTKPPAELVERFDGLGVGFEGPQGTANLRNPSDNTLAVGPNHIVQIVNSQTAIFTKKGRKYDTSGKILYGPVPTANVFKGFGGQCEATNNGDAVVRYDQIANRWLIVMPLFRRGPVRSDQPGEWKASDTVYVSPIGVPGQPGKAAPLFQPPPPPPAPPGAPGQRGRGAGRGQGPQGPYSMCYAISTSDDPLGSYYRYEFLRPLFPDYPRPAIWRDGYYVPTSTGDEVIQKHACVVERDKMLKGEAARELCAIIDNVNFLNNADVDGKAMPPSGAPNIMFAAGGTQLKNVLEDDGIYYWKFAVDWKDPAKTKLTGPQKITVAPYHYLCDGQLKNCVPQPGTDRRLDSQGDKIMSRVVYRKIGNRESMVAVHSVNTTTEGGGVRWYELLLDKDRNVTLHQQGTYAPEGFFRWLGTPAIDRVGNIALGYSFGGPPHFAGQRFTARLAKDPPGQMTLRETVLVQGEDVQTAMRWEDYTTTAMDPSDDCTIWYVGDYIKKGAQSYSSKIGAFRLPGCR